MNELLTYLRDLSGALAMRIRHGRWYSEEVNTEVQVLHVQVGQAIRAIEAAQAVDWELLPEDPPPSSGVYRFVAMPVHHWEALRALGGPKEGGPS